MLHDTHSPYLMWERYHRLSDLLGPDTLSDEIMRALDSETALDILCFIERMHDCQLDDEELIADFTDDVLVADLVDNGLTFSDLLDDPFDDPDDDFPF